ncbi:MAG TPA: class II glutamine amidotransferase [Rhodobacteraceae bacterium]|jgi:predicted glutamine amidotransferase|nr:class II glutamine amidotransferase [Paracoccaceae bacterium]HBV56344.1 class II glutamine amidotransferase [Paracoccaceae bacterium]
MCRWAAYRGEPIFLSEIVTDPSHSLIAQSHAATHCHTPTNADGFGVAWYDHRPEPGLYRDVYPAWSDPNLRSLAAQVRSGLFMAHVRASTGTATSRNNCHPFVCGRWSFMHNGQIGGFEQFRKDADMMIPDALYSSRKGATDSEALFLVAMGFGLDACPRTALQRAAAIFEKRARTAGASPQMRLTAALSDGERLYAVRYASDDHAPTLYYRWSDTRRGWAVVSEPLDDGEGDWNAVASGSFVVFDAETLEIHPFAPLLEQAA